MLPSYASNVGDHLIVLLYPSVRLAYSLPDDVVKLLAYHWAHTTLLD